MRISEVLNLRPEDVDGRKLILRDPKSGREAEVVFIPHKVADRIIDYIEQKAFISAPESFVRSTTCRHKKGRL
ncbi:MAG: hypothetical protein SWH78_15750 [Thermodesulfobacteriota bacterium]|nr:hypothetical protein [Thermodesulfobacteriota bacterium]